MNADRIISLDAACGRERARGNWLKIHATLAPDLVPAIKRLGRHVCCPVHGGKNGDGFRLFPDAALTGGGICNTCGSFADGFSLLMWLKNWTFPKALYQVASVLDLDEKPAKPFDLPKPDPETTAQGDRVARHSMMQTWEGALSLSTLKETAPVFKYFVRRGLDWTCWRNTTTLRFHPALDYYHNKKRIGTYPALLALVYGQSGKAVSIHRTYMTQEGKKAPVPKCKKLMKLPSLSTVSGGAIRTAPCHTVLAVSEGIEDALAVHQVTKLPVWVTPNAGLMETFVVPSHVELLIIFANKDHSQRGQNAARALQKRTWAAGTRAQVHVPQVAIPNGAKGIDWNDLLIFHGERAFPQVAL